MGICSYCLRRDEREELRETTRFIQDVDEVRDLERRGAGVIGESASSCEGNCSTYGGGGVGARFAR